MNPYSWYASFKDLRLGGVTLEQWLNYWKGENARKEENPTIRSN